MVSLLSVTKDTDDDDSLLLAHFFFPTQVMMSPLSLMLRMIFHQLV